MKKLLLLNILIILSSVSYGETVVDIEGNINKVIEELKEKDRKIVYDKEVISDNGSAVHLDGGKRTKAIFNADAISDSTYIVWSNDSNPVSAHIINNATLKSKAITISTYRGGLSEMFYLENNGTIDVLPGSAGNIGVAAEDTYIKNAQNAKIQKINVGGRGDLAVENEGEIFDNASFTGNKSANLSNKKSGKFLKKASFTSDNGEVNLKNDGFIYDLGISGEPKKTYFENNGEVEMLRNFSEYLYVRNNTDASIKSDIQIGVKELDFENNGNMGFTILTAQKGKLKNNGNMRGGLIINPSREEELLTIDLKDGNFKGKIKSVRKGPLLVELSDKNIVDELELKGDNDTLKYNGVGEFTNNKNTFKGLENLYIVDSEIKLGYINLDVKNLIIFEKSEISIEGTDIYTKNLENLKESKIYITNDFTLNGNLSNSGDIYFSPDNSEDFYFLRINKNYKAPEIGNIKIRVKLEEPTNSDKIYIEGNASGITKIDLINPNSTLKKRLRGKIKLVSTKTSSDDAFSLLKDKYGIYKYYLNKEKEVENENWYLSQKYITEIGNVVQSISTAQELSNLSLYDHSNDKLNIDKELWIRSKYLNSKNILSNRIDTDIDIKNNLFIIEIGKDLIKKDIKNKEKYGEFRTGVYANLGFDRSVSSLDEDEKSSSSQAAGLGIYTTWKNKYWFVDGWMNYTYLNNIVNGEEKINYVLSILKSSIELGNSANFKVGDINILSQQHWQLIYSYITNPKISIMPDLKIFGNTNLRSRLGISLTGEYKDYNVKPFLEFNWYYDKNLIGLGIEDEKFYLDGNKNVTEIKWGVKEYKITENLNGWINILHRFGERGYKANSVEFGIKYIK